MKRLFAGILAGIILLGLAACGAPAAQSAVRTEGMAAYIDDTLTLTDTVVQNADQWTGRSPKYVFLFIGDGISYPQFQAASDYQGAIADSDYMQAEPSVKVPPGAVCVLYGTYNPFSVTVTHILNNKSGIDFTSYSHTGLPVAVFADSFKGYYDNTAIYTSRPHTWGSCISGVLL